MQKTSSLAARFVVLVVALVSLSGCIMGYRGHPPDPGPAHGQRSDTLLYRLRGGTIFGGMSALRRAMQQSSPFALTQQVESRVESEPNFVNVQVRTLPPSVPALVAGYVSLSFLTLIPFVSTQDGYEITYELFQSGRLTGSYRYTVQRSTFGWLPVLPVSWITLLRPSESDAFTAITNQFYREAGPLFGVD